MKPEKDSSEKTSKSSDKKIKENSSPAEPEMLAQPVFKPRALGAMSPAQLKQLTHQPPTFVMQPITVESTQRSPQFLRQPFGSNSKLLNQSPATRQAMQQPNDQHYPSSSFDFNAFQHESVPLRGAFSPAQQSISMTPVIKYQSPQKPEFTATSSLKFLTPNPKKDKVELDFKSLQNYILSNIDSSDKDEQHSDLVQSDDEIIGISSKPWALPVSQTSFIVKEQTLCSLKGPQHSKITLTPVPKSNLQSILPKADLNIDSPQSKLKYKNFLKDLKDLEHDPFINQLKHSLKQLPGLPSKLHWRVLLDLADLAKRESQITYAARLFKSATTLQPYAYQGWLEWAKLCEESGEQERCKELLKEGLSYCIQNENLVVKSIKVYEKDNQFDKVRKLYQSCDQWRVLVEGAQFEGRIGDQTRSRALFQTLCTQVGNGPVFLEASRHEEREGNIMMSLTICEDGLDVNPRYAPLWFQYLRLYEKCDKSPDRFDDVQTILNDLHQNISFELEWKIYIEAAQMYERTGQLQKAAGLMTNSVVCCPDNIKWKVWLLATRLLMRMGEISKSRQAIERSCFETPSKQLPLGLVEYAKHFEMLGQIGRARELMDQAKKLSKGEWKTQFEAVMLEVRSGQFRNAEEMVQESLEVYFATGRLWATLIQMRHARAATAQDFVLAQKTFEQALNEIPKSGEVWCEGARIAMSTHPQNPFYSLKEAEKYLLFAIQFTPQYGDSFLELLRFYLLQGESKKLREIKQQCIHLEPNYGVLWFYYRNSVIENAIDVWDRAQLLIQAQVSKQAEEHYWIGDQSLMKLLRTGMQGANFDLKAKLVYGFECVLPQVAFI